MLAMLVLAPQAWSRGATCSDFATYEQAQAALPANPQLDRDKDGVACENLPKGDGAPAQQEQPSAQSDQQLEQEPSAPQSEEAQTTDHPSVEHDDAVYGVAYSPDSKYLATASADKTACIWEAASGSEVKCVHHKGPVNSVAFSPKDGKYIGQCLEYCGLEFFHCFE